MAAGRPSPRRRGCALRPVVCCAALLIAAAWLACNLRVLAAHGREQGPAAAPVVVRAQAAEQVFARAQVGQGDTVDMDRALPLAVDADLAPPRAFDAGRAPAAAGARGNASAAGGTRATNTMKTLPAAKRSRKKRFKPVALDALPALSPAVAFPFNRKERIVADPAARSKKTNLRFRVGPRKDLQNYIAPMLRRLGLTEVAEMDWVLYIGMQFKPEYEKNYINGPAGALVSSVPGLKEVVGDKEAFARLWRRCMDQFDDGTTSEPTRWCDWTTPAFNVVHKAAPVDDGETGVPRASQLAVDGGVEAFRRDLASLAPSIWIVKPQRRYLSLGMHLAQLLQSDSASAASVAAWVRREVPLEEEKRKHHTSQPGEFTLQKYVERPATIGRRKFDLRLWALLASVDPIRIYLLDVAFPKISVVDYDGAGLPLNVSALQDKCMHIQMMASEVCMKRMTFPDPFPFQYPGVTRPDIPSSKSQGRSFFESAHWDDDAASRAPQRRRLQKKGKAKTASAKSEANWLRWQTELWPELERAVVTPLLMAKPGLLEHQARLFGDGADGEKLAARQRRFALISPDALWDVEAQKWRLEEINTNGLFQLGADDPTSKTFHVDEGYTEGWLRLAGADGFPNKHTYADVLEQRLSAFCALHDCQAGDLPHLRLSAHEGAHSTGGWYRAWPPETRLEKLQSAWLADLDARYFAAEAAETKAEVGAGHRDTFPDYII
ncbi:tubulin-tyrosine ligase family-domain-containing protein [Pelagophyceae sp. CCMP2097]|nr:tubulin-tyrosine ligase family-domain-containing protein [Pelagophyceae sp. CCMP2097]